MFGYYLKLGALSIRRNPVLSSLMIAAIATGIGAFMTVFTIDYVMSGNPIPHKSEVLFHVQLDSWDPNEAAVDPDLPPQQVTYTDGTSLLAAGKARRQVLSYRNSRVIEPADPEQLPFMVSSRATSADFFPMFDTPFLYGTGWDKAADDEHARVVVINQTVNEQVFGGEDSVGRTLTMNGANYRVTGVLDEWQPTPKFYDVNNGAFNDSESVYFPLSHGIDLELGSSGNTNCWKPFGGNDWGSFLASECVWLQFWVELHGRSERSEYLSFLDAYALSQKELGRFPRPLNNRLSNVMEWMEAEGVVDDDVQVLLGLAGMFLVVCLLNTIGLLLAKVMRRSGDISLRRALGASRHAIFAQYTTEAGIIGAAGGLLGIGLTWLGLQGIRGLYADYGFVVRLVTMDWVMILAAIGLAIAAALGAALYPTWRASMIHPASELKAL